MSFHLHSNNPPVLILPGKVLTTFQKRKKYKDPRRLVKCLPPNLYPHFLSLISAPTSEKSNKSMLNLSKQASSIKTLQSLVKSPYLAAILFTLPSQNPPTLITLFPFSIAPLSPLLFSTTPSSEPTPKSTGPRRPSCSSTRCSVIQLLFLPISSRSLSSSNRAPKWVLLKKANRYIALF